MLAREDGCEVDIIAVSCASCSCSDISRPTTPNRSILAWSEERSAMAAHAASASLSGSSSSSPASSVPRCATGTDSSR
eukprot:scaffold16329_cov121-Isochrysis_galbana.AAC.5